MQSNYIELQVNDTFPEFSQIKTPPKSTVEALWVISMLAFPMILWWGKELIKLNIEALKAQNENKLAEDKQELQQRDALINHLKEQNNVLLNEIMILRRTMDFSGDFSEKKGNTNAR